MKSAVKLFVCVLGMAGFGACQADAAAPDATAFQSAAAADGVQHVRIEGGSYFFKPNRVVVRVNVPVELTVRVESGVVPHTFVMQSPEAGIAVDESLSRDAKTIRFTPTAVGSYAFYCKDRLLFFKSHRDQGMDGVLEVIE